MTDPRPLWGYLWDKGCHGYSQAWRAKDDPRSWGATWKGRAFQSSADHKHLPSVRHPTEHFACMLPVNLTSRGGRCCSYPIKQVRKQPEQYSASKGGRGGRAGIPEQSSQSLILKDDIYPGRVLASPGLEGSRNLGEDSEDRG